MFLDGYNDLLVERHEPDIVTVSLVEVGRSLCYEGGSVSKVVVRVRPDVLVMDDVSSLLGSTTCEEDEVECYSKDRDNKAWVQPAFTYQSSCSGAQGVSCGRQPPCSSSQRGHSCASQASVVGSQGCHKL